MSPRATSAGVEGEATDDPLTGVLASFVPSDAIATMRAAGLSVRSGEETIALRLEGALRSAAGELLGLSETQRLLDRLRQTDGPLVRDVVPAKVPLGDLTTVLRRLVSESVSIADLRPILEQLARDEGKELDPGLTTERVRHGLRRQLSARYARDRRVEALILDGDAEEAVRGAVRESSGTQVLRLEPDLADALLDSVRSELGGQPARCCSRRAICAATFDASSKASFPDCRCWRTKNSPPTYSSNASAHCALPDLAHFDASVGVV